MREAGAQEPLGARAPKQAATGGAGASGKGSAVPAKRGAASSSKGTSVGAKKPRAK